MLAKILDRPSPLSKKAATSLLDRVARVVPDKSEICGLSRQEADRYLEQRQKYDRIQRDKSDRPQLIGKHLGG